MESKIYRFSFTLLKGIMLLLAIHWLLISILQLKTIASWGLLVAGLVLLLGYLGRSHLVRFYRWLMGHKSSVMIAAVLVQLIFIVCAELLIRRDAAVVYTGAFGLLKESSISSYLTRNPNNIPLFLYERFFYVLFGNAGLWIMQLLNMVYVNAGAWILYRLSKKHFNQTVADASFSLYVFLACFSPYFYSMYTDIPPLPLIGLQLLWNLDLLKEKDVQKIGRQSLYLGILSGVTLLIRPTTIIVLIALWGVLLLKGSWKKFGRIFLVSALSAGLVFGGLNTAVKHQTVVPMVEGEGLAKGPLLFINLGLTDLGHNQADMKKGLLVYIDEDKRDDYNNGMFKTENVIKEIKRRLKDYGFWGLMGHFYYKQSLTVAEGTLGWLYRDADNEKTPFINPLYEPYTKNNAFAQGIRTYFLSIDRPQYVYYEWFKQLGWIVMAVGLVLAFIGKRRDERLDFLALAVFGGLLFLTIFEGGKTRYLIQFLPQILLLSAVGLASLSHQVSPHNKEEHE